MSLIIRDDGGVIKLMLGNYLSSPAKLAASADCCNVKSLIGKTLEVTLQGLSSGLCTNCAGLNATFLTGVPISAGTGCCVQMEEVVPNAGCTAATPTAPGEHYWFNAGLMDSPTTWGVEFMTFVRSSAFVNSVLYYRLLDDVLALDEIHKLARGAQATIPLYKVFPQSDTSGLATCGTVVDYSDNLTNRQCISDGSAVLLSAV